MSAFAPDGPLMSSARTDWNTPQVVVDALAEFGPVGLDPCSNSSSIVPANERICLPKSGLDLPWETDSWDAGLVFVNPPYSRAELPAWADKIVLEAEQGCEIIALVPARPDTDWWRVMVGAADAVCFWRGRLRFLGAPAAAPFPSALMYFGDRAKRFRRVFGPRGWVVNA